MPFVAILRVAAVPFSHDGVSPRRPYGGKKDDQVEKEPFLTVCGKNYLCKDEQLNTLVFADDNKPVFIIKQPPNNKVSLHWCNLLKTDLMSPCIGPCERCDVTSLTLSWRVCNSSCGWSTIRNNLEDVFLILVFFLLKFAWKL
jgi:hypothetical protein